MLPHSRELTGFSMVELVIGLGIVTFLVSVGVVYYREYAEATTAQVARADLDVIEHEVLRWQLENRADYPHARPALRDGKMPLDPWGQEYLIDTKSRRIASRGPNGADEGGSGDDISVTYDRYLSSELKPPSDLRAIEQGPDWVELGWTPVQHGGAVLGYNVYRRESQAATGYSTAPMNVTTIPADTPRFRDSTVVPGRVYYFTVEVLAADGQRAISARQLGFSTWAR